MLLNFNDEDPQATINEFLHEMLKNEELVMHECAVTYNDQLGDQTPTLSMPAKCFTHCVQLFAATVISLLKISILIPLTKLV